MLTYNKLGSYGRLGNQMFQIASTIGIAKSNNITVGFNTWICSYSKKKYEQYLMDTLPKLGVLNIDLTISEKGFQYSNIILPKNKNIDLKGYFQSEKYFENCAKEIKSLFTLNKFEKNKIITKYPEIHTNETCSIHIRRGDYLNLQGHHPVINKAYYESALNILYPSGLTDVTILIFSDDIEWCKNNICFPTKIIFVEGNDDILELFLMSYCKNNIIANSSFSWWAAWLNINPEKKIIAPKEWFGEKNKHLNTSDIYCKDWIKL